MSPNGWVITGESKVIWVVRRTGDPMETPLITVTDPPLASVLPWQVFATVTRSRGEDFEQALGRLEKRGSGMPGGGRSDLRALRGVRPVATVR